MWLPSAFNGYKCRDATHFTPVIRFSLTKVFGTATFFKVRPPGFTLSSHRVTFSCLRAEDRTSLWPSDTAFLLLVPFWAEKVLTLSFPFCQGALSYTSSLVGFPETTQTPVRRSSLLRHCLRQRESHTTILMSQEAEHTGIGQSSETSSI